MPMPGAVKTGNFTRVHCAAILFLVSFFNNGLVMGDFLTATNDDVVCSELDEAIGKNGQLRLIVTLDSQAGIASFEKRLLSTCKKESVTIHRKIDNFNMLIVTVNRESLQVVCSDTTVKSIHLDNQKK